MSFFDDASLVFLPSGEAGKDGKAYSMKPTNGNGDFTFSRGSNLTATRVDSNGLIEKGRENLLLQSNQFDTTWLATNSSVTSGQSGYDGSSDAWLLTKTTIFSNIKQSLNQSNVCTFSVYAKANTYTWLLLHIEDSAGDAVVSFDLDPNTIGNRIGSQIQNIYASIESVGNGWYRCSITALKNATEFRIYPNESNGYSGAAGSIYIQDAQVEQGLIATEYIESGATTGLAGILEDSPRFDYSGGASCPSLLLEPSRTNEIGYSEYFEGWTPQGSPTITSNFGTSPEGLQNSSRLRYTTDSDYIETSVTNTSGVFTLYAKGTGNLILTDSGANASSTTALTSSYQRIELYFSTNTTTLQIKTDSSGLDAEVYAAQFENATYATSYIPNHSGGSVTRELDHCFTSSNSVLEEISATYFLELTPIQITSNNLLEVRANGSTNNRILLQTNSGGALRVLVRAQGSSVLDQNISGAVSSNTKVKIALKYTDRTNISVFVDGVKEIDSDLVIDFNPELNGLDLEGSATNNNDSLKQHQFIFFPTALSDSECITLTS